ncbi:MAG: metallophosphoesterase [Clostridiales bacterium]|nr:metallophosphoesterase [Clostridiales bacterium]
MKLLFVGDTHGTKHLEKVAGFLSQARLTPQDAVIHCGDTGVAWLGEEDEALRFWRALPQKVVFCLGNHENYRWMYSQPRVSRYSALGHDLGGRIFAPLHGQVARLGGRSLWFYPGGYSIDFYFRVPGRNVFHEEMLEPPAARRALNRVLDRTYTDFIVTHDGPRSFVTQHFNFPISQPHDHYWRHLEVPPGGRAHPAFLLDELYSQPQRFGQWFFGHHHQDVAQGKLRCLWQQAALVDTRDGATIIIS